MRGWSCWNVARTWTLATSCVGLVACGGGETAVMRGNRLWADSSFTEALAEYRLAVRQGGDEAALLRVAHTYGRIDRLQEMRETYEQLVRQAPEYTDQAVYDFLEVARRAQERGDRFTMAGAVEAALALRADAGVSAMAVPLARYYAANGDVRRALDFFERALVAVEPDSAADLLYEMGIVHEQQGDCAQAIGYFAAYSARDRRGRHASDARWHTGQCAFELGRAARQSGQPTQALAYLGLVIELGVPESLLDQAWYERGEVLFGLGRFDQALLAYRRVIELNPARTGQLVQQAQLRIDQIRFDF